MARVDTYQQITDQIVEKLEGGEVPWKKPWKGGEGNWPKNLKTGRKYNGINALLLSLGREYESPYWLTFNQAKELGGHVKKGEKSVAIVFWNFVEKDAGDGKEEGAVKKRKIPYIKSYRVFNADQCVNLKRRVPVGETEENAEELDFNPIKACESLAAAYKGSPEIHHGGGQAFYRPLTDTVHIPERGAFVSESEYYSVLFHELAHSTGSKGRLDRDGITNCASFGTKVYSEEELVAELSSAFLCGITGIIPATVDNSAAYIQGWLKRLKDDKKLIVIAAAKAQKAANWITGERNRDNDKQ